MRIWSLIQFHHALAGLWETKGARIDLGHINIDLAWEAEFIDFCKTSRSQCFRRAAEATKYDFEPLKIKDCVKMGEMRLINVNVTFYRILCSY